MDSLREIHGTVAAFAGSYWASLAIAAVASYLGLFTVLRRIVFTGVALAQLAAAGVAASFFLAERPGLPPGTVETLHRYGPTMGSLSFSLLGMLGLESRAARRRLSPDALVGLAYAAASAIAILLVWRSAVGLVELQNILAGDVLLSDGGERTALFLGLGLVGLLHLAHRRAFLLVSYDPDFARAQGYDERHYQWLLLGSLAVAVALALETAGLLLVFAYLVLPALSGLSLGRDIRESARLAIFTGLGATLGGYAVSTLRDWPVAPSIALVLLLALAVGAFAARSRRLATMVRGATTAAAALAVAVALSVVSPLEVVRTAFGTDGPGSSAHGHAPAADADRALLDAARQDLAQGADTSVRLAAAQQLATIGGDEILRDLLQGSADLEAVVRAACLEALAVRLREREGTRARLRQIADRGDPEIAALACRALIALGDAEGIRSAISCLPREGLSLLGRDELLQSLIAIAGSDFGYDSFGQPENNTGPQASWEAWWQQAQGSLEHDPESGWRLER